jgi:conjugative relaxase-like TrwC/TraI family protein
MLRVRTIYARSAAAAVEYYTRYLTEAPGEVPGRWLGRQAPQLDLVGHVAAHDLQAILEGFDPRTGTALGRELRDRELADGKSVKAVAGFDATFSAPKSLSVLWALTRDERLLDAHDVAVNATLAHLEHFGSTTRVRSADGRLHPDSRGLTIAAFRQTTSRADDPQIHTHCVISAKVQTGPGRWLALDARYLKRHQRMLGGLYQSVLRNELTNRFGLDWGPIDQGQAEMTAMPDDLLSVFSKRADEIGDALAVKIEDFTTRQGRDPNQWELGALKREAAVDTRAHKSGNGVADLVTRWDDEAASVGWDAHALVDVLNAESVDHTEPPPTISVEQLVDALSASGSTWNRAQIIAALTDIARPDPTVTGTQWAERIEHWADAVIAHCTELDPIDSTTPCRTSNGRSLRHEPISPHITTEAILAEEEHIASWALAAQADGSLPSTTVDVGHLDVLQADVARAVAGLDQLVLVVGPAGTGKTTTLRAAIDDLDGHRRPVFGVAPSAKGARVLKRETGIATDTLDKLLHEHVRGDRPPLERYRLATGTTVIVDEAGMVGTHSLAKLVRLAESNGWRVALVGDPYQLQAVGRGGMFHELTLTGHVHELDRIYRFTEPWEAAASLKLRRGDPRALDDYLAHDRIVPGTLDEQLALLTDR